jgi:adenylosuccinate lyase
MVDWSVYLSPLTWRYGSPEMRQLWSERTKRLLWRKVWVALAQAQATAGLIAPPELADIEAHGESVDIEAAHRSEAELGHDLMAELHTFASQCPHGGGRLHLGATSADIEDNADALRIRESLRLVRQRLVDLLHLFRERIAAEAATPCLAFTHLQPAEATTVGYRLAQYAQDLLTDLSLLDAVLPHVYGKGLRGAVGTAASYGTLLIGSSISAAELEGTVMERLGLPVPPVTTQTYPRKADLLVVNLLAGIAQSCHRFALDLRLLQSPPLGEWQEPFREQQVGSSAMPFKRNPVLAERICSLARFVAALPSVAWGNAAGSMLERTLDDSANRRLVLPEAFLAVDDILLTTARVLRGLRLQRIPMARNLQRYGTFANTETLLMALVRAGADRQVAHEVIRQRAMDAWQAIERGEENPLVDLLASDPWVTRFLPAQEVRRLLAGPPALGRAEDLCRSFLQQLDDVVGKGEEPSASSSLSVR